MKSDPSYKDQLSDFWALVKYASESLGYSSRSRKTTSTSLRRYKATEIQELADRFIITDNVELVVEYLNYRANLIENEIHPLLMDRESF